MHLKHFMPAAVFACLLAVSARADLGFVLVPAAQPGAGSNEVFFTASLTNTDPADNLFLNGIQISFTNQAGNHLVADTNSFYANVPGILAAGGSYADVTFGIIIASDTPPGEYGGTVTLQGGADIFGTNNLSSQSFQVLLPPSTLGISAFGTNVMLSWASPPGGFGLQQNSDLTTTNWVAATNAYSSSNGQDQVILSPAAGGQLFYRLVYPQP